MDSVKDLLDKISDFKCKVDGKEIVFLGILQAENQNIILTIIEKQLFSTK